MSDAARTDRARRAAAGVLGIAPDDERLTVLTLLYANDFEQPPRGTHAGDVKVAGAFDFAVQKTRVVGPEGPRTAVRFPTQKELGHGYDHSMQSPYAHFKQGFVGRDVVVYGWTVHLPEVWDYTERTGYWENRVVFGADIEGQVERLKLRFLDNERLGFVVVTGTTETFVGTPFALRRVASRGAVDLTLAVSAGGRVMALVDGEEGDVLDVTQALERVNRHYVTSTGNTIRDANDLRYFSALSGVWAMGL